MGSRMTKLRPNAKLSALVLAAAALIPAASPAQGVAERAGEVLDNAGRTIRRGVEGAVARGQATVREQDVFTRVYSRIHWDKALVGSVLELEVRADGMAILRGSVPDAAARKRAVVLARDTVGVTGVVDELGVPEPARVIPAPPPKPSRVTPAASPPAPPLAGPTSDIKP